MCIDPLPEKLLQAIKKERKSDINITPLRQTLQKVTLVSPLLFCNAKIFKSYILISTCKLFRI